MLAWGKEHVAKFIKQVAPPGEELRGFDDRILFDDAVKLAEVLGKDGMLLHDALMKLARMKLQEL